MCKKLTFQWRAKQHVCVTKGYYRFQYSQGSSVHTPITPSWRANSWRANSNTSSKRWNIRKRLNASAKSSIWFFSDFRAFWDYSKFARCPKTEIAILKWFQDVNSWSLKNWFSDKRHEWNGFASTADTFLFFPFEIPINYVTFASLL